MRTSPRWLSLGLFLAVSAGCGGNTTKPGGEDVEAAKNLEGAGSSFVYPMMQEWTKHFKEAKGIQINYQSKGSSAGIDFMIEQKVDFGCTDAPMSPDQLKKAKDKYGDVLHIPLCMGALVPAYNLDGNPEVKFTGELLARIYLGEIKKWDHPDLQKIQDKDVALPDLDIVVVARSDGSGSSYIFSDYLSKIVGKENWTPGVGLKPEFGKHVKEQQKTDGVAGFIKGNKGALGYVEIKYALDTKIPFGLVQNEKKTKFIRASTQSVTAAAASTPEKEITDDLCFSMTNAPGADAYPISGTVWAVLYVNQEPDKAKALKEFLTWATHDGQKHCEKLHYAPLSENLVKKIDAKLASIKTAGK